MSDLNAAALAELAEVKGQLKVMTTMLMHQHQSINQRIDDMRGSMDTRFDGVEERLGTLEQNERGTALRTAGIGAISAAIVGGLVQFIKFKG